MKNILLQHLSLFLDICFKIVFKLRVWAKDKGEYTFIAKLTDIYVSDIIKWNFQWEL